MMNQLNAELGQYHPQYLDERPVYVDGKWHDGKYFSAWWCGCGAAGGLAINDVEATEASADDHECPK